VLTFVVVQTHPAVAESAAVGSPDLGRGEIVKAFVILSEEFRDKTRGDKDAEQKLIADIQTHFKKVTAPYKAPRAIEFVEELPKTVSGKIRRVELRELEQKRKADVLKQQRAKL
jgi:acyl-coenzyme A synthetase/AMP-(fatty) acid ligase